MNWNPKIKTCWVDETTVGFGVRQYTCFSRGDFSPIGFAWIHSSHDLIQKVNTANLLEIYVVKYVRRKGVAGLLVREILKNHRVLRTGSGSKEGGKAFLKAAGFKYSRQHCCWYLRRKR